jgi:hypothetical protein
MARRFWVGRAYRARHERRGLGPAACSAQALKRAIAERSASARRRRSLNSIGALLALCSAGARNIPFETDDVTLSDWQVASNAKCRLESLSRRGDRDRA